MSLIKRNGGGFPQMPKFFDDFFARDLSDWIGRDFSNTGTSIPAVNIRETNDEFQVEMAAPGMKKSDFNIELENDVLKITSEKTDERTMDEGERYTRREFSYQSFERSFHLPKTVVDDKKIQAAYEDGMLKIIIPKKETAKSLPPRKIKVK